MYLICLGASAGNRVKTGCQGSGQQAARHEISDAKSPIVAALDFAKVTVDMFGVFKGMIQGGLPVADDRIDYCKGKCTVACLLPLVVSALAHEKPRNTGDHHGA
jgi:hypothetical protein